MVLSKIQHPERIERHYLRVLESKKIVVDTTCLTKVFSRWNVAAFRSVFPGELPVASKRAGPGRRGIRARHREDVDPATVKRPEGSKVEHEGVKG